MIRKNANIGNDTLKTRHFFICEIINTLSTYLWEFKEENNKKNIEPKYNGEYEEEHKTNEKLLTVTGRKYVNFDDLKPQLAIPKSSELLPECAPPPQNTY